MGDLDGNGVVDFAVGNGEYGRDSSGSVFILFLNPDHTVLRETRIGNAPGGRSTVGGLQNTLGEDDYFGTAVECLGDLDGDGVPDLIVGADGDDDDRGALYVLFLLATGTVKMQQKIGYTEGGLQPFLRLRSDDWFGTDLSVVGGLDEELGGVPVLVGSAGHDRVHHLIVKVDGTVGGATLLKDVDGGRGGRGGLASVGDVDGNGVTDFAIGVPEKSGGRGGVHILLMEEPGTTRILSEAVIGSNIGGMGYLNDRVYFGHRIGGLGDLNNDGIPDIAVGAPDTRPLDAGSWGAGAVYILLLNKGGLVKRFNVISADSGGLVGPVKAGDNFGGGGIVALVKREDSEQGVLTLVVGAWSDNSSVDRGGSVYVLTCKSAKNGLACRCANHAPVLSPFSATRIRGTVCCE